MTMIMEYPISALPFLSYKIYRTDRSCLLMRHGRWLLYIKKYKDTDSIVDHVEGTPKSGYTQLRVDVEDLVKETIALRTSSPATPLFGRSAALSGQWNHYS